MKCKSWSNKINNFVVRRLKSIKSNGPQHQPQQQQQPATSSSNCATSPQPPPLLSTSSASSSTSSLSSSSSLPQQQQQQYLNNCCSNNMPAMPQEKATAVSLTENNFSELKLKEMTTSAACVAASAASAAAAMATTATAPLSTPTPALCRQQNHRQQQQQRHLCGCVNASAPDVTMRNKFMTNGHSSPLTAAMATQNSSPSSSPQRLSTASIASSGSNSSTTCCRLRYQQQQQQLQQQQQQQTNGIGSLPTDTAPLASSQTSTSSSVGSFASSSMSSNASASLYPALASQPATIAITPPKKSPKDFIFGKYIGEGSFSVVYLAVDVNTKREFGIKVCEKRQILRERKQEYIRREREVMHMMTNVPGFVNLSCTFQDTRSLYFVMTYAKNGDLLPYINKVGSFDIDSTRHYAAELVLACEQMHRRNIIHRDLKPENILLDEDLHTLIADFGSVKILTPEERAQANEFLLSGGCDMTVERKERSTTGSSSMGSDEEREIAEREQAEREQAEREQAERENAEENEEDYESTGSSGSGGDAEGGETDSPRSRREQASFQRKRRSSFVGTAQYVSPEVLQNETITPASDLWALGCIIYQMMSGLPPFRGQFEYTIFREIVACKFKFPQGFDKDAEDLVKKLIQLNPAERLGALDMNGRYESIRAHPFFKNVDFDTVRQTTPPPISPFLPDLITEKEEFTICENLEPGLDEKQLTRLLGMELGCISDDDNDRKKTAKPKPAITTTPALAAATPNNLQKSAKNSFDFTYFEKHKRLELQRDDKWNSFADGEVILKKGLVNKRKGLFARKRMLLLTTGPRLIYIDPVHLVKKGEIPWSAELRPEAKNFKIFFVHTPNRTYYLDDPEGYGLEWVAAIEKLHQATYKEQSHTSNHNSNSNNAQQSTSSTATSASSCSSTSSANSSNSNRLAALALTNNNNNNNNNHSHSTSSVTKTSSAISSSSIAHKTSSLLATPFSMMKTASN